MSKPHKEQPSYGLHGITEPWEPISDEMKKGLELAAYICRMYGEGEAFAGAIESRGEQIRGRWWMEYEKRFPDLSKDWRNSPYYCVRCDHTPCADPNKCYPNRDSKLNLNPHPGD